MSIQGRVSVHQGLFSILDSAKNGLVYIREDFMYGHTNVH